MCGERERGGRPVCVFDSGAGGLNLLYECASRLRHTSFCYFADNYNVPYGSLPAGRIRSLVSGIFEEISSLNPLAAVVACNTATAVCISRLRARYSFPIIGIQPAVKQAVKTEGECLVLATPATLSSPSFAALCASFGKGRVRAAACPALAGYIEEHIFEYPRLDVARFLPEGRPSSVVLGCTHYVFAKNAIAEHYGCATFDGILGTADHLCTLCGKEDKNSLFNQKISFFGGDFNKNSKIYSMLSDINNK